MTKDIARIQEKRTLRAPGVPRPLTLPSLATPSILGCGPLARERPRTVETTSHMSRTLATIATQATAWRCSGPASG